MKQLNKDILMKMMVEEAIDMYSNDEIDEASLKNIMAGLAMTAASVIGGKAKAQVNTSDPATNRMVAQNLKADTTTNTAKYKQVSKDTSINVDFGTSFGSGKADFDAANTKTLSDKFKQIASFIKQHPNSSFDITINASESRVPQSNIGYGEKELATARANTLEDALKIFFDNLKKENINVKGVNIKIGDIKIGGPVFAKGKDDPADQKFKDHQYVNATISAKDSGEEKEDIYKQFASRGDKSFYLGGVIQAIPYYRTRETGDVKQAGNKNTAYEDVLVRFVDKNGKFTGEDYIVPSDWLNNHQVQGSAEGLADMKKVGKRVS